jgi:hypothetical protein
LILPALTSASAGRQSTETRRDGKLRCRRPWTRRGGSGQGALLRDEHSVEDILAKNWSTYNAADEPQCVGTVKAGGSASYLVLLSCLEIMRDAKEIREADQLAPEEQQPVALTKRRR